METLKQIVKGTTARLSYVCEGKVYYTITTEKHTYQLEINSCDEDWKATFLQPEFKAISLMRWIRKGMKEGDKSLLVLK